VGSDVVDAVRLHRMFKSTRTNGLNDEGLADCERQAKSSERVNSSS
jgi:hypothetical protein